MHAHVLCLPLLCLCCCSYLGALLHSPDKIINWCMPYREKIYGYANFICWVLLYSISLLSYHNVPQTIIYLKTESNTFTVIITKPLQTSPATLLLHLPLYCFYQVALLHSPDKMINWCMLFREKVWLLTSLVNYFYICYENHYQLCLLLYLSFFGCHYALVT